MRRGAGIIRRAMGGARRRGITGAGMVALGATCVATSLAGASAGAAGRTAAARDAARATVEIVDFAFSPATLTVDAGTTVVWTNTGENDHTITGDDGSFLSGRVTPGNRYRHTFRTAGAFAYHCSLHESMEALITVRRAPTSSTTAASTSTTAPSTTAPPTTAPPTTAAPTTVTTVSTPDDLAKTGPGSPTSWLLVAGVVLSMGGIYVVWTRGPRPVMARTRLPRSARPELPEDVHTRSRSRHD